MEMITRRGLIGGLAAFIAAPAIIKVAQLMPIKAELVDAIEIDLPRINWHPMRGSFGFYAMIEGGLFYFNSEIDPTAWHRIDRMPSTVWSAS